MAGVEPTNNAAERGLRRAVLRRKRSYGSQSEAGCPLLEGLLGGIETLRQRGGQVLDYLSEARKAHRHGLPPPGPPPRGGGLTRQQAFPCWHCSRFSSARLGCSAFPCASGQVTPGRLLQVFAQRYCGGF